MRSFLTGASCVVKGEQKCEGSVRGCGWQARSGTASRWWQLKRRWHEHMEDEEHKLYDLATLRGQPKVSA